VVLSFQFPLLSVPCHQAVKEYGVCADNPRIYIIIIKIIMVILIHIIYNIILYIIYNI
jgi:hypothetical protein